MTILIIIVVGFIALRIFVYVADCYEQSWLNSEQECTLCRKFVLGSELINNYHHRDNNICKKCAAMRDHCYNCHKFVLKTDLSIYDPNKSYAAICTDCRKIQEGDASRRRERDAYTISCVRESLTRGSYYHYRQTQHWEDIRKEALINSGNKCAKCGSKRKLQLHHLHYKTLGEESSDDVVMLCPRHHAALHRRK